MTGHYFGVSSAVWLGLQAEYDLDVVLDALGMHWSGDKSTSDQPVPVLVVLEHVCLPSPCEARRRALP
ncbi:MAG: hypothetical protein WAZ19_09835 [Anaerolineae bacterium]